MKAPVVALFNNKGGVGKTSLVYHLAWMYEKLGLRVLAVDLDPQANLTSAFLSDDRLEKTWDSGAAAPTIYGAVSPLIRGVGDVAMPHLEEPGQSSESLALILGDLRLSTFEDELATSWGRCLDRAERAFRVVSAFWRVIRQGVTSYEADLVLVDLGPNLGALNRVALTSTDHVIFPLAPDLFSLRGLENLGPTLRDWRQEWRQRAELSPDSDLELPPGSMHPLGYVVLQHSVRLDRPVRAYERWIQRIPQVYKEAVLGEKGDAPSLREDPNKITLLKHYRSLMPLAQEARKPVFALTPADGALGGHYAAVQSSYDDFRDMAQEIAQRLGVTLPALTSAT